MEKKVFVVSLGCPKNLVDTEVMLGLLGQMGYQTCAEPEEAELILVNTCGFIQSAAAEAVDEVLRLAALKEQRPGLKLVVAGCLVQRYGQDLIRELPEVDLFVGTENLLELPARVAVLFQGSSPSSQTALGGPRFLMHSGLPRQVSTPPHRAYLKITEGCSNRCSYCVIPAIRGPLRSRPLDDVLAEATRLDQAGVKELTLIGQDLTAYGLDLAERYAGLPELLVRLLAETSIPWLRLLYLYPHRLDDRLLRLLADNGRLTPYLDIPLQHVSPKVLRAMNRPAQAGGIEELFARIRELLPQAAIRSTFIVGFPGEDEEDVRQLEDFLRRERLDHVGVFAYSSEEGSAAAKLPGRLGEREKNRRRDRLLRLQAEISLAKNQALIGRVVPVLVEGVSAETELLLEGRMPSQAPEIDGCVYITDGNCATGDMVKVRITEAHTYDLAGEIVG